VSSVHHRDLLGRRRPSDPPVPASTLLWPAWSRPETLAGPAKVLGV